VYGFAVPAAMDDRDAWHKPNDRSITPELVPGVFAPTAWKWDGAVKNFEHDQVCFVCPLAYNRPRMCPTQRTHEIGLWAAVYL
jgi:hypothetical protein